MRKAFIAGALFGALLFIAAIWLWGTPAAAGSKDEPKGKPVMDIVNWDMGDGDIRKYAVFYTEHQFRLQEIKRLKPCKDGQCAPKDAEGFLVPPPKDAEKKVGM